MATNIVTNRSTAGADSDAWVKVGRGGSEQSRFGGRYTVYVYGTFNSATVSVQSRDSSGNVQDHGSDAEVTDATAVGLEGIPDGHEINISLSSVGSPAPSISADLYGI